MASLPNEIILHIIESLIPPAPTATYPPNHPITRTLINLTLTSKLTHPLAKRLLTTHCLYISSSKKLYALLRDNQPILSTSTPKSLFLAPFPSNTLKRPYIVNQLNRLSLLLFQTLTRLIIDIPIRALYPNQDRKGLKKNPPPGFSRLTALEEFCSVRDELFCTTVAGRSENEVWTLWPRLKRLALYNVAPDEHFVLNLRMCPALTHLVLVRPDVATEPLDPQYCWFISMEGAGEGCFCEC